VHIQPLLARHGLVAITTLLAFVVFFHVFPDHLSITELFMAKLTINYILMLLQIFSISKGLAAHKTGECLMYKFPVVSGLWSVVQNSSAQASQL
jgi:hypothetical protein